MKIEILETSQEVRRAIAASQAQFDFRQFGKRRNPFEHLSIEWQEYDRHYSCLKGIAG